MALTTITRVRRDRPEDRLFWREASGVTHVVLRLGVALLFMQHGGQKLFGWFGGMNGEGMTAALPSQMGIAGLLELGGGMLLLVGFLTRPVALVLAGEMVAAYLIAHMPRGGLPIENQGELALLFGFVFLYFVGSGAGWLSIDHLIAHRDTSEGRTTVTAPVPAEDLRKRRGRAA